MASVCYRLPQAIGHAKQSGTANQLLSVRRETGAEGREAEQGTETNAVSAMWVAGSRCENLETRDSGAVQSTRDQKPPQTEVY